MDTGRPQTFERLARRPWTGEEREQVLRGFSGRVLIAIEPFICAIVLTILTVTPFAHPPPHVAVAGAMAPQFSLAQVIAPILAFGAVGFAVYAVGVMVRPLRAVLSTLSPIYIVDGYLRYRTQGANAAHRRTAVAILSHEHEFLQEWIAPRLLDVRDGTYPAMVEFSCYGGILRIDGRRVDPPLFTLAPFGIGSFQGRHHHGR